jgi:CBS domain-containing protein
MPRTTPISEIMTTPVRTVSIDANLSEARQVMNEDDIHHVAVVDGDTLMGIITSTDLVRIYRKAGGGEGKDVDEVLDRASTVSAAMSTDLVTIRKDDSVERAVDLVADGAIHSVLVVDDRERLVGIVTVLDLLDFLGG